MFTGFERLPTPPLRKPCLAVSSDTTPHRTNLTHAFESNSKNLNFKCQYMYAVDLVSAFHRYGYPLLQRLLLFSRAVATSSPIKSSRDVSYTSRGRSTRHILIVECGMIGSLHHAHLYRKAIALVLHNVSESVSERFEVTSMLPRLCRASQSICPQHATAIR